MQRDILYPPLFCGVQPACEVQVIDQTGNYRLFKRVRNIIQTGKNIGEKEGKMSKIKKETIGAKGFSIQVYTEDFKDDYISLTDIARYKNKEEPKDVVKNWLRIKDTIEFLGLWESMYNENFNSVEFDRIKSESGYNSFTLSPQKWTEEERM